MIYTVKEIIWDGRYAFIFFVSILALKFIRNRRIPENANFIPFFIGLIHAIFSWVIFYRTAVMGHPDRMINISLEIIAYGSLFTVILILVDVVRALFKRKKRKKNKPSQSSSDPT